MTYLERAQAIGDALVNGVATPAQLLRLAKSLTLLQDAQFDALPVEEKAKIIVERCRGWAVNNMDALTERELRAAVAATPALPEAG